MRSIKVALATAAVLGTTISGAYAAGVLNKLGHEVNAHAAHGQSVAAAARAKHTSESTEVPTATDPADEPTDATSEDAAAGDQGEDTDDQGDNTDDQGEDSDDQGDNADDQGEDAEDQGDQPSTAPANVGRHLGQTKAHKHYGHAWGRGHGSGRPAHPKPTHPVHPTHPAHPAKG